jgi:hypothetical protein
MYRWSDGQMVLGFGKMALTLNIELRALKLKPFPKNTNHPLFFISL